MKQPDGSWVLNGEKRYIGNGSRADVLVTFARCEVDGEDRHAMTPFGEAATQRLDERALPGAGHAGHADADRAPRMRQQFLQHLLRLILVSGHVRFDERDSAAEQCAVTGADAGDQLLGRGAWLGWPVAGCVAQERTSRVAGSS